MYSCSPENEPITGRAYKWGDGLIRSSLRYFTNSLTIAVLKKKLVTALVMRCLMGIYRKIDKTVKMHINSYLSVHIT